MAVIPVPLPSAMSVGNDVSGARFLISSRASSKGGRALLPVSTRPCVEHPRVGQRRKCEGHTLPDGVMGPRTSVDYRFKGLGPPCCSVWACGEDRDSVGCGGRAESPPEQFGR